MNVKKFFAKNKLLTVILFNLAVFILFMAIGEVRYYLDELRLFCPKTPRICELLTEPTM